MSHATEIARGVIRIPAGIPNAYIVGDKNHWTLIDTGMESAAPDIRDTAAQCFGGGARPEAILLTHGHFDHAGSAARLAREWHVPVYAHHMELPYLTGKSKYPPPDPTVGGFMSQVIRFFPNKSYDLGDAVAELNVDQPQSLEGWRCIETPGHTPGHVSFYRQEDGVLIAGDAFTTVNQDNLVEMMSKRAQVCRPPAYYTPNWRQAHESVRTLADLSPRLLAAGHGEPMGGNDALRQLRDLAENFPIPSRGRYVKEPPVVNENGVLLLPPPSPDPVKNAVILSIAAGTIAAIAITWLRDRAQNNDWRSALAEGESESPMETSEPRNWDWRNQA